MDSQRMATGDAVPVIDFEPFLLGGAGDRAAVARQVDAAATSVGFLILAGHGIPRAIQDEAFAVSREFFDLPEAAKLAVCPERVVVPRGYQVFGRSRLASTLGRETPGDLREQFFMGPLDERPALLARQPRAAPFYAPNIWPTQPARFASVFNGLYRRLEDLSGALMRSFALGLGLEERYFDDKIDQHFSTCTSSHYPALTQPPLPDQLRCGTHTDFGSLTILLTDDAPGGLQVARADGSWMDVKPRRDQVVVNLGDMMARWTNERWRSTLHRVVTPQEADWTRSRRQTIGFFLHPNYDAAVSCLPNCTPDGAAPRFAPILAGDHMREKLEKRVA